MTGDDGRGEAAMGEAKRRRSGGETGPGTIDLAKQLCPHCGYAVDAASALSGAQPPAPGDIGLCLACSGVVVLDDRLQQRAATPAELDELRRDEPRLWARLQAARALNLRLRAADPIRQPAGRA